MRDDITGTIYGQLEDWDELLRNDQVNRKKRPARYKGKKILDWCFELINAEKDHMKDINGQLSMFDKCENTEAKEKFLAARKHIWGY